jgi:hypothetical protein
MLSKLNDSHQLGVDHRLGQEPGVEGTPRVPPATYVELQQCAMYQWDNGGEQCKEPTIEGRKFCAEHTSVKLCKTSGVRYQYKGNSNWCLGIDTIYQHPVDAYECRTARAMFCSDRCRNLWRDTKTSRGRQVEIEKLKSGGPSNRYEIIKNYRNSGETFVLDKKTSRLCGSYRLGF